MPSQRGVITVAAMFDRAQRNKATHRKAAHNLMKLQKHDSEQFTQEFISLLRRAMVVKQKAASVDRVIQFAVYFAVSTPLPANINGVEQPFYALILKFMIQISVAKTTAARFRACQSIANIIFSLSEETELENDLYEAALDALEIRAKDKDQSTRVEAARALSRFQDPDEPDCTVTPLFLRMLENDSVAAVRKQVLNAVNISKRTIGTILGRTRDKNADIRKHAFSVLKSKVDVRALTIKQRCFVLETGLNDREEKVRDECAKMLNSWYKSRNSNVLEFLRCLHIELNESTAEKALLCILKDRDLDQSVHATIVRKDIVDAVAKMNPDEPVILTNEMAFFWRIYCDFFDHEVEQDSELYLPEVARYCALILFHHQLDLETQEQQRSHSDFVINQLLKLAHKLYLGDEAQRKMFSGLLCDLLVSPETPESLVEQFMNLLNAIHTPDESVAIALDNIARIQEPLQAMKESMGDQIEKIESRLEEMVNEMQYLKKLKTRYIAEENFEKAKEAKMDMRALQEEARPLEEQRDLHDNLDEYVNLRSLHILAVLVKTRPVAVDSLSVQDLDTTIVEGGLTHDSFDVIKAALECRALFCFENRQKAKDSIGYFTQVLQDVNQDPEVQLTAMKCVFDLMTVYSVSDMQEAFMEAENRDNRVDLINIMVQYLDFDGDSNVLLKRKVEADEEVPKAALERAELVQKFRSAAVNGFARLYFLEAITADNEWYDKVLSQLVLLFFSSDSAEQNEIRQCLSVFFSAFTSVGQEHHFTVFERIFMPCLRLLFNQHITVKSKRKRKGAPAVTDENEGKKAVGLVAVESAGLKEISYKEIGFFFLDVTAPRPDAPLLEQRAGIHERLAGEILRDIVSEDSDAYSPKEFKALTVLLSKCCIDRASVESLDSISALITEALADVLTDRTAANTTKKVVESIAVYKTAAEEREACADAASDETHASNSTTEEGESVVAPVNETVHGTDDGEEGEAEEASGDGEASPSREVGPAASEEVEVEAPKNSKKSTARESKPIRKKVAPKRKPLQERSPIKRGPVEDDNGASGSDEDDDNQETSEADGVAVSDHHAHEGGKTEAAVLPKPVITTTSDEPEVSSTRVRKARTPRKAAAPRSRRAGSSRGAAEKAPAEEEDEGEPLLPRKRTAAPTKRAPATTRKKKSAPLAEQPAVKRGPLKSVFAL